jgi:integrase
MKLTQVYRSTKDEGQITVKLRHYKKGVTDGEIILHYKTPFLVYKTDFKNKDYSISDRHEIEKCMQFVKREFLSEGEEFIPTKDWFHKRCNIFFKIGQYKKARLFVDWVDKYIETLELENKSLRRIKNLKQLKSVVNKYDKDLAIKDLVLDELDKFKLWLMKDQRYGINTANNIIADFKLICKTAELKVSVPIDYRHWKKLRQSKAGKYNQKEIITLTREEIKRLEELELKEDHLINARKWLIIGVNTAQRGSELLSLTKQSFKYVDGSLMIDFSQKKVGKAMRIPALKRVKELYESEELPYKIAIQNLNDHLKTLGKLAKIDTPIRWYKREVVEIEGKKRQRHILKERPKYEYLASHIFRRTFCTYYMEMEVDAKEIMKISGHESKEMLMTYVKEARPDFTNWKKFM